MFAIATDMRKLVTLGLHRGGPVTEPEIDKLVATVERLADALAASGQDAFVTSLILVETDHSLKPAQRKRVGEATNKIDRGYQVLVTRSVIVRAVMTAIRWFAPATDRMRQETFGTYEEARAWLTKHARHPAELYDRLYAEAREQTEGRATASA